MSLPAAADFSHLLPWYYRDVFPWDALTRLYAWEGRVVGLTPFASSFSRHIVADAAEFKALVLRHHPIKIDLGAYGPKESLKSYQIDLDLPDYADLSECKDELCSGKGGVICDACWQRFMVPSIEVLQIVLRHDLGLKRILWSFSGRKGVHAEIFDGWCCALDNEARKHLTQFISHRDTLSRAARKLPREEDPLSAQPRVLPRLDVAVSTQTRHLLKAVFSPHPDSGRLALPLSAADGWKRPDVTLVGLAAELDRLGPTGTIAKTLIHRYRVRLERCLPREREEEGAG